MAELFRPAKPPSQVGRAIVPQAAFDERGVDPDVYSKYCARVAGSHVEVKVSPASLDYLEKLPAESQDRQIVRALPYTQVNDRPRIWSSDFALAQGAKTREEVEAWHKKNRIRSRATKPPTLRRPPTDSS